MRAFSVGTAVIVLMAGCGRGGAGSATHSVSFDVGGFAAYVGEPGLGLGGVAVTLLNADGETSTATTGSSGLWSIDNLRPGAYTERYALPGYEPVAGAFALEAFGENDVSNPFVARPDVFLEESRLRATVTPFDIGVEDASEFIDGVGNQSIVYDVSVDGPVVVEFSQPIVSGFVILEDEITSDFEAATFDSASMALFVLSEIEIDGMNTGAGLTTDGDPLTRHRLSLFVNAYSPIHGTHLTLEATIDFNAVP